LVVVDLVMPVMDGVRFAERLAPGKHPPILFITAFSPSHYANLPGKLLQKPFSPDELIAEVQHLLAQPMAPPRSPEQS
jgi:DNA-binding response OmpR family regulator